MLHYGRTHSVADHSDSFTPRASLNAMKVGDSHRVLQFRGLEHPHHMAVRGGPDVGESVDCRYGSQGRVEALPAAGVVRAVVNDKKWCVFPQ